MFCCVCTDTDTNAEELGWRQGRGLLERRPRTHMRRASAAVLRGGSARNPSRRAKHPQESCSAAAGLSMLAIDKDAWSDGSSPRARASRHSYWWKRAAAARICSYTSIFHLSRASPVPPTGSTTTRARHEFAEASPARSVASRQQQASRVVGPPLRLGVYGGFTWSSTCRRRRARPKPRRRAARLHRAVVRVRHPLPPRPVGLRCLVLTQTRCCRQRRICCAPLPRP